MIKLTDLRPPKLPAYKPVELARKARHRAFTARVEGARRLWTLEAEALARAEAWLGKAPEKMPVVARVADAAERFVARRLVVATAVPIDGYDELNAKQIRNHLRDLSPLQLSKVIRYEMAHKHRKSVVAELEKEMARRLRAPAEAAQDAVSEAAESVAEAVSA